MVKRTMVQNEIVKQMQESGDEVYTNVKIQETIVWVDEAPIFKFDIKTAHGFEEKKENAEGDRLSKDSDGNEGISFMTRCEVTIQRIETHMLDASPVSLVELANGGSGYVAKAMDGVDSVASGLADVSLNGSASKIGSSNGVKANESKNGVTRTVDGQGKEMDP